jgi:glycosyltransferase involved in cell wall biosynthesis
VPQIPPVDETPARPTWSVMIPVHDCAGYLARALPEVLAQLGGRDDAEIVVVDDASGDDPGAVVDRLGGGRVQHRPNPGHLGAVGTFNRCVALARGELVHLLHGDDAVLPGFYPRLERAFADPTVVAALCRARDVDAEDRPTHTTRSYRRGTGVWPDALESLAVSNRVRAPSIVVRRSAYELLGGYRTDLPHAADWEMWTRLAAHGRIVLVDEVLACYRRHAASDTSSRVRTGANVRERVTAIGVVLAHVPPGRRRRLGRRALLYATVFALRTALQRVRVGDLRSAARQGHEALRCLRLLPAGVPLSAMKTVAGGTGAAGPVVPETVAADTVHRSRTPLGDHPATTG